jgi:pilus assembly protein CpaE
MTADPDIALVDIRLAGERLSALVNQIHEEAPRCQVLVTAPRESQLDAVQAMRGGVRGLVHKPIWPAELLDTIQEVFAAEQRRLNRIEEVARARAAQGRNGDVITVFSAKGGVGCTVIASNLAIALANYTNSKVALVDFSLQFGDVAVLLNLQSSHGVHELMRSLDDLDNALINDVTVEGPSGVRVLLPPPTLELVEEVETDGLTAVIKAMRRYYDYVVVDMWHSIEEATLAVMELSNTLLVVTTPEVPALRNTRRFLDLTHQRPDLRGKVQIVVNRFPSKGAVTMKDIEQSLEAKPLATIPSDGRLITTAINEGVSFLSKSSAASKSVRQLASTLAQPRMARQQRADGRQQIAGQFSPADAVGRR